MRRGRSSLRDRVSRCFAAFAFLPLLDAWYFERVGTPLDETVLEPGQGALGGERDHGEDEHRREDAIWIERRLGRRDDQPDTMDRAEVLADDRADEREAEARVEARKNPRKRGRQDHVRGELALARAQDSRVRDQHAVDLTDALEGVEEDHEEHEDDGERDLRPDAVADGDDEDGAEHDTGHRVQRLDIWGEHIREQTDPAERDTEDHSHYDADEEPEERFLEGRRYLKPERSLRGAVLHPRPELARDAGRAAIEERVDEETVFVGRVDRCADLPEAQDDDRERHAQSVDEKPVVRARTGASTRSRRARLVGARGLVTRRCA